MAYKYCDWTNGNDLSGDGTAALPYKSIEKALQTLVGGDEARVAKSPAHTALSGTLNFLDGSNSVATSVNLTGSLAINDFIGKNVDDMCWWSISDITASTITLHTVYSGTTEIVSGYKMGAHDLGTAAAAGTVLDRTNGRDGASASSRLKISGGWNLGTETQDSETFFKQTGSSIYGIGLELTGTSDYIEIEKLHYARCYRGIYIAASSSGSYFHDLGMYRCYQGLYMLTNGKYFKWGGTIRVSQSTNYGIYWYYNNVYADQIDGSDCILEFRACSCGIFIGSGNTYYKRILSTRPTGGSGIHLAYGDNIRIGELEIIHATTGIYTSSCDCCGTIIGKYIATDVGTAIQMPRYPIVVNHYIPTAVGTDFGTGGSGVSESGIAHVRVQRYGNVNYTARMFFLGVGYIYQDSSQNARSTRCLRFAPSIIGTGLFWQVGNVKCMNTNLDIILSVYIKKDNQLNGSVWLAGFVLGRMVAAWEEKTTTTSYAQYSITIPHADLVMTEYVELQVRVNGTAGNVYVDDFSVSQ